MEANIPRPQRYTAIVKDTTFVGDQMLEVILEVTEPFEPLPGQFISIRAQVSPVIFRSYSILNVQAASTHSLIHILADITPMGAGSLYLKNLKKGDTVEFIGPSGRFLVRNTVNPKVFIGTGTGIVPLRPMVLEALDTPEKVITLFYGARNETKMPLHQEFTELRQKHTNFAYFPTQSQPSTPEWQKDGNLVGRVTHALPEYLKKLSGEERANTEWYICGNEQMIADVTNQLRSMKIDNTNICTEAFD